MDTKLADLPLFEGVSAEILTRLEPLFEPCLCYEGTIFEQGDPAIHFYLVIDGAVDIFYKPYDSPPIMITSIKSGGIFGWSAIAGNTVYTSSAACAVACKTMRIRGADLRNLVAEHPEAGKFLLDRLASSVSSRWQNAQTQVRDIISLGITNTLSVPRSRKDDEMNEHNHEVHSREEQIKGLLAQVSAYIEQYHGGWVEFVSLEGDQLTVRLGGACQGCSLLPSTLHGWVEGTIRQFFPDMQVRSVD